MRLTLIGSLLTFGLTLQSPVAYAGTAAGQEAEVITVSNGEATAGAAAPTGMVCGWEWYQQNDATGLAGSAFRTDAMLTERLGRPLCNGVPGPWTWITIADDNYTIQQMYAEARRTIPKPLPTFSPPLEPWQYRKHPMQLWFTAAQLGMPALSAVLPSGSGITMAPAVQKVSFDPGNSEAIIGCEKPKPIEKGDCSYSYPETSKDAPNLTFPARILITWDFPWSTSDGRSGTLPPATFAVDVGIRVAKIQVIGG